MSPATDEVRAMGHVMERVLARFPDADLDRVRLLVEREHHLYDGRPIREFVPVLVEREVTNSLRLASQRGSSAQTGTGAEELLST